MGKVASACELLELTCSSNNVMTLCRGDVVTYDLPISVSFWFHLVSASCGCSATAIMLVCQPGSPVFEWSKFPMETGSLKFDRAPRLTQPKMSIRKCWK